MLRCSQPAIPQIATLFVCEFGALVAGVGVQTEGNVDRKSLRVEQKKQRLLSLCSQENKVNRDEGFGLDLFCQACSCVWIGKKGITVQKKILFRFYSSGYWIKEKPRGLNCVNVRRLLHPRQEEPCLLQGRVWTAFGKQRPPLSISPVSGEFSIRWSHSCYFPFLCPNSNNY